MEIDQGRAQHAFLPVVVADQQTKAMRGCARCGDEQLDFVVLAGRDVQREPGRCVVTGLFKLKLDGGLRLKLGGVGDMVAPGR